MRKKGKAMKFFKRILGVCLALVCLLCFAACGEKDYGTLTIADIEDLKLGETREISAVFSNEEYASEITYEFKGSAIKIENGEVTALSGGRTVPVTAKTEHHETTFTVKTSNERLDNGTLTIGNIENLAVGQRVKIDAVFTPSSAYEPVSYTFEGNDIAISNGYVSALAPDKTVTVTAKTKHHEVTFTVQTVRPKSIARSVTAWIGYPASPLSDISYFKDGEAVTWSGENAEIAVLDKENRTLTAVKEGAFTLTASAEGYSETYSVTVKSVSKTGKKWELDSDKTSYSNVLKSKWNSDGNDGKTTLFIGDSFFDVRHFWTNFYDTYAGKDAICAGISGSTSYDWEQYAQTFLSHTAPKNIVMHMGTNNFYDDHDSAGTATESLQRMFTVIHSVLPEANIYYFAITQRADTSYKTGVSETNAAMREWCEGYSWITFLDTEKALTEGMLRDGIHPKLEHYGVFTGALAESGIGIEAK